MVIYYDGETSNLHSRLQETIKKREVPEEVIRGVNKFLEEIMKSRLMKSRLTRKLN